MRIGNFGRWGGDKSGGHHPPACTCVECNERRLRREAVDEEERRAREYDRRVAQSRARGQGQPPRSPWVHSAAARVARPRRRGPSLRLLLVPLAIVASLAGVFLYVTSNGFSTPETGGEPLAAVAIVPTEEPTESAHTPVPAPKPSPMPTRLGTVSAPVEPVSAPTSLTAPHLRHIDEKLYMLELINEERARAGVLEVELGDNKAAQLHAQASLEGCFSSHWGLDGLKPYMRYSLAGGYQSNGENGSGLDYCIKWSDWYSELSGIREEIRETMTGWMNSPGHRRNILEKSHRKVNIGLAWDRYNIIAVQHFEGDYVEYEVLPEFDEGRLRVEGRVKNGARFDVGDTVPVEIFYDPPPRPLTRGQLSRTYCYGSGLPVAYVREPLTGDWYYDEDTISTTHEPCASPYDIPPDAVAPRSSDEAHTHWQQAYNASQSVEAVPAVMQAVTASSWSTGGSSFRITAGFGKVLNRHGPGVYTVVLWGVLDGGPEVISEYSIFHDIPAPSGYD